MQALIATRRALRLLLLGSLRAHLRATTRSIPRRLQWRARHAARDRSGRGRGRGAGAPGGRRHREGAPGDDAGGSTSTTTCCRARARSCTCKFWATAFELLKERKAIYFETEGKNKGCWVMPGRRSARLGRGRRRQQGDRALERHGHLRRQGHRLSALEVRPAGQGLSTTARAQHLSGRPRSCG